MTLCAHPLDISYSVCDTLSMSGLRNEQVFYTLLAVAERLFLGRKIASNAVSLAVFSQLNVLPLSKNALAAK